jgi:L-asparaginase II
MPQHTAHDIVAEVWRGDLVESVHHGVVVVLDADGSVAFSVGDPEQVMYPRSANKPLQALAMLRAGLDLDGELLALACASHSGEPSHLDGVRRILASAGRTEQDLQCAPGLPLNVEAQHVYLLGGGAPAPLAMNCSGKHAAMLATCVVNGWPIDTYRSPEHPLQRLIADTLAECAGEPIGAVAVDGCGAPLFALTLTGLARGFRHLALAAPGTLEHRVVTAMNTHPAWVGGTGRDVTALMSALPGTVAKDGAEGVYALALPDGRAIALKIADGAPRARPVVMVAVLRKLGVDVSGLADLAEAPVLGHGERVGSVRATL